jgi:hypothetical protein
LKLSRGVYLIYNNSTRWNSWAKALKLILSHPFYNTIKAYFKQFINNNCRLDKLLEDNWALFYYIQVFLESISQTTKALESNSAILDNVLSAIDFILDKYKKGKE